MKIKKLNAKTKEGLSFANLETFYSSEWGEDGGLRCDILFDDKIVAKLYQAGEGGETDLRFVADNKKEVDKAVISFLKRYDTSYMEGSKFEWLVQKTHKDVDASDYESLVSALLTYYEYAKKVTEKHSEIFAVCEYINDFYSSPGVLYFNKISKEDIMKDLKDRDLIKENITVVKFFDHNSLNNAII